MTKTKRVRTQRLKYYENLLQWQDVSNWEGQTVDTDLKNAAIALKTTGAGGIDTLGQVCTQLQRERDVSCDTNVCMKMFKHIRAQRASGYWYEGCLSAAGVYASSARWTSGVKYSFITSMHVHTPIYRNTFTATVLKLPILLERTVQTVTCRLKCQRLKRGEKKRKRKRKNRTHTQITSNKNCTKHKKNQKASGLHWSHAYYTVHKISRLQSKLTYAYQDTRKGRRDHCCTASLSPARLEAYEPSKDSCSKSNNGSLTLSQLTQGKLGVPGKSKLSWEKTASCLAPGCPKQETRELESCILKTHLYLGWCGCRLECTLCLGPSHSSHSASSADVAGHRLA